MNMWSENAAKGISPDIELKTGDEKPEEEKLAEKHGKKSAAKVLAAT
jgi:C-terminal processing protease CtpA/Prc